MADLDTNALEARVTLNPKELIQRLTDELAQLIDGERDDPDAGIRGWNSLHDLVAQAREYLALPPVADDVTEMVKRLEKEAAFIIGMPGGREMYATITEAAAMLEAISQSRAAAEDRLFNLLARIHRDGGHYLDEHGIEKACADADEKVAWLHARDDARPEAPRRS